MFPSYTRRTLLSHSALTLAGVSASVVIPKPAMAFLSGKPEPVPPITDERLRQLVARAVDAAVAAGASYADARLTYTSTLPSRTETMEFGVRTLVDGYWGFAASPLWSIDEAARLGASAAAHSKANVLGQLRKVDLAPISSRSGHWDMPIKDDPFKMAPEEIGDFWRGLYAFTTRLKHWRTSYLGGSFTRQEKAFGSSLGQYTTQRIYRTEGKIVFLLVQQESPFRSATVNLDTLSPAGLGFEYFRDQPLREYIVQAHEEAIKDMELPILPIDVGRYPILINAAGTAKIISQTIGNATQIDRAMGYEANAGGTSYITDPLTMLGAFKVGSPLVTICGGRSDHGSVGRVEWDEEGVEPSDFVLIDKGTLVNMQTSREGAGWIQPHYTKTGQPFRSFGCLNTSSAIDPPLIHSADLTLIPSMNRTETLETLRTQIDRGVEFASPNLTMDFQQITGLAHGKAYQIQRGQRSALLQSAGVIFRTPELWNNVSAIGGELSSLRFGLDSVKGEPAQVVYHSVMTPPVLCKEMSVIDVKRKA